MIKRETIKTRKQLEEIIANVFKNDTSGSCEFLGTSKLDTDIVKYEYYLYFNPETGDIFENATESCEYYKENNGSNCERLTSTVSVGTDDEMYEWEEEDNKDYTEFEYTVSDFADLWEDKFGELPAE